MISYGKNFPRKFLDSHQNCWENLMKIGKGKKGVFFLSPSISLEKSKGLCACVDMEEMRRACEADSP